MTKRLHHEPPLWVNTDAVYFITICAKIRGVNQFCQSELTTVLLESVEWRHKNGIWHCFLALIMPDHVHLLLSFVPEQDMTTTIRNWKNWLGRIHGVDWQDGFFDHWLRNEEKLKNKADYILHNPVRAGLVERAEDWPHVWHAGK